MQNYSFYPNFYNCFKTKNQKNLLKDEIIYLKEVYLITFLKILSPTHVELDM